jgi:sterol 3beta-glucosyltransferase
MQITILTYGSRGDVQPYLALGLRMQQDGHVVRLAAPRMFEKFIVGSGVGYAPLPGDPARLMKRAFAPGTRRLGPVSMARGVLDGIAPAAHDLYPAVLEATRGADVVVHSLLLTALGHQAALERDVPDFSALLFALFTPTREFPCPLFPRWRWSQRHRELYNIHSHREFSRAFWHINQLGVKWLRRRQPDLPALAEWSFWRTAPEMFPEPVRGWQTPVLYGISEYALPRPAEWDALASLTGYWFLDTPAHWQPPIELVRFLEGGSPPVVVSFGSVISAEARRLVRSSLKAVSQLGRRVVLVAGWGSAQDCEFCRPGQFLAVDSVPFDWLLPRSAGMIYHAGMGTTAEALRAGIPVVAIPQGVDQPFWAQRVQALGVGLKLAPRQASYRRLAGALERVLEDRAMQENARTLSAHIRGEDGCGQAVRIITAR